MIPLLPLILALSANLPTGVTSLNGFFTWANSATGNLFFTVLSIGLYLVAILAMRQYNLLAASSSTGLAMSLADSFLAINGYVNIVLPIIFGLIGIASTVGLYITEAH